MQKDNAIERWVEHLNLLAPVQGLIHVGAGVSVANTFYAEWPLTQVLLIEADENSAAKLLHATQHRNGWVVSNTLVSSNPEVCDFYVASNLNESGLIAPELLTPLWKNLKTKEVRSLQPTPLSALITQQITAANWLIIENLTALDILKSAAEQLNQFDVICVRALRNPLSADLKESSQEAVHRYLVESAFTLLQVEEEVQPNVINLLYTRDLKKIHGVREAQLTAQLTEKETQAKSAAEKTQALMAEEANKNAQLLQAEKESHQAAEAELNKQLAEVKKQLDEKTNWYQKVVAEKEAQAKSASEKAQFLLAEEANKSAQLLQAEKESHRVAEAELSKQLAEVKKQLDEKTSWYQKVVAEKEAQAKSESEKAQVLLAEEANKSAQLLQAEKESHRVAEAELSKQLAEVKKQLDEKTSWYQKVVAEKEAQAKSESEKAQVLLAEEANKSAQLLQAEKESHRVAEAELSKQLAEVKKQLDEKTSWYQKVVAEKEAQAKSESEKTQVLLAEEANKSVQLLQAEKESHQAAEAELNKQLAEVKKQLDEKTNWCQKVVAEKEAQAKSESEKAQALLSEESNKYAQLLKAENETHQAVVAELKAQIDDVVNQHQKAIAEKEAQQSELALTIEGLSKEKNGIWGRCKELQACVDVLEKESGLLKTEKESHQAAEAELNKQLAEVKKQLDEKTNWYQKVVAEKETQAKSESEKAQTLLAEEANKSAQLLKAENETHQAVVAELKTQLDGAASQHQKAIAEKEAQQSELALTIEGLSKEKNGIWGRCKELQACVDVLEKESGLLKTEKESHQAAEAELNKQLAEVKKQLDEKTNWYQKVVAEKEAQLKAESEKAQALLAEEANKSAQLLQAEKKSHETLVAELATCKAGRDQALALQVQLQQELVAKGAEIAATKKERDDQSHWNQKHKDWAESLKREIETLKKDYAEGERAQSLALKLQAKAQVDLENLRTQYQQKLKQEQNLIELIRELQLKLQAAANYYHQLQLQHPELSAESKPGNTNNAIDAEIISRPIASKRAHKKRK